MNCCCEGSVRNAAGTGRCEAFKTRDLKRRNGVVRPEQTGSGAESCNSVVLGFRERNSTVFRINEIEAIARRPHL